MFDLAGCVLCSHEPTVNATDFVTLSLLASARRDSIGERPHSSRGDVWETRRDVAIERVKLSITIVERSDWQRTFEGLVSS